MSDIQRYWSTVFDGMQPDPSGSWVTYADHVAAVAAAEQRVTFRGSHVGAFMAGYEQGQKDGYASRMGEAEDDFTVGHDKGYARAISEAVAAVEALTGDPRNVGFIQMKRDVIAAIKGVGNE